MGQVTSSGSDPSQIFPIFLSFSYFPVPQEQDIPAPELFKTRDAQPLPGVLRSSWGAWETGTAQLGPTAALKLSSAPQDPVSLRNVGVKVRWDFPSASQLAPSCSAVL